MSGGMGVSCAENGWEELPSCQEPQHSGSCWCCHSWHSRQEGSSSQEGPGIYASSLESRGRVAEEHLLMVCSALSPPPLAGGREKGGERSTMECQRTLLLNSLAGTWWLFYSISSGVTSVDDKESLIIQGWLSKALPFWSQYHPCTALPNQNSSFTPKDLVSTLH